jgi:aryl-alcohol dehydrogenase-like predicted oxidoreductase
MNQRKLGSSDVTVSEVSLGCWTLGGLNWNRGQSVGWAEVDEGEAVAAIHDALDAGVNHFDNADVYGNGRAERMLARALGKHRKDVVIATKVGHHAGTAEHAYDPLHIHHQCEQSLKNLNTDYVDVYYFHHGDFAENDRWLDDAVAMMRRLKDEGKVRLVGLSAYSAEDFARLVPKVQPAVLQSWAHLMDDQFIRPGNPVPKLMEQYDMTFVAFSPLNQGILLDKYDPNNPPKFEGGDIRSEREKFQRDALRDAHAKLQEVKERFGETTEDLARVALQFILAHDHVACVIPGFRNRKQVACNLAAAGKPLSADDVVFLREVFANR